MSKSLGWGVALCAVTALSINCGGPEKPKPMLYGHDVEAYQDQLGRLAHQQGRWNEAHHQGHLGEANDTLIYDDASNATYTCWLRLKLIVAPDKNPENDRGASYVPVALIQRNAKTVEQEVPLESLPENIRGEFTAKKLTKKAFVAAVTKYRKSYPVLAICTPR